MNLSVEKLCNLGGCVLVVALIVLLLFKPRVIMSFFEGQNNTANYNGKTASNNGPTKNAVTSKNNNNPSVPHAPKNDNSGEVMASLPQGDNEQFASVSGIKTPTRSCYPQNSLKPDDLLPQDKKNDINDFDKSNPVSEGILKGVNFLEAGYQVGVNTVGQSLRNSNQQLRSEPANPQVNVSPWQNTTIGPDLGRRPLESGEDCYASVNSI
tara:strand:- start:12 stop:641 length:630 start_codon:yes stop_codon:yes gene_type:complete